MGMNMSPLIISANFELRLLHLPDADELFQLTDENREHLREWLPWLDGTQTVGDTESFILSVMRQFAETRAFSTGIWWDAKLVGVIGFNRIDWSDGCAYPGYWLGKAHQGKGIMTRSCRALIDHAFSELRLEQVIITCATENSRSRAIPERLGFQCEGVKPQAEWLYDHYVDHAIYSLRAKQRGTV